VILARLSRAVLRIIRNTPVAATVLRRHLDADPSYAISVTLRALPKGVRRLLVRTASGRSGATAALMLNADGNRDAALVALRDGADGARRRKLRRLIATAAALDAPTLARELLGFLPTEDAAWPHLSALVRGREGSLALGADTAPTGWRDRRLRRRLTGELRALSPDTVPTSTAPKPYPAPDLDRVLHLVTNALPEVVAGYTVRTQGIAAAQRRIGVDVHVSTRLGFPVTAGRLAAAANVEVDGVPHHRLLRARGIPRTGDKLLAADIEATARLVRRLQPGVLHAHSKYVNAQVALALRARYGLPVVYEVRGFLEETWRSRGRDPLSDVYQMTRSIETECMRSADAVVTISEGMKAEISARGVPADHITVVPNSVDEAFLAEPPDATELRHRHGVGPDELLIGVVSTLNEYEGVDVLIDALAQLLREKVPARLIVVGDGPERKALANRVDQLGLNGQAIFTGRVPFSSIREYHSAIDVFCVPRLDTPVTRLVTPLKPLEAMATGRPVVASDLPPLREIVKPDRTGSLVAANDANALAQALAAFASDADLRTKLGIQARRWVAEHRTWSVAANRYRTLYQRIGTEPTPRGDGSTRSSQ
jgi:glycosyltransferase involved in cell wall biosynthesis